MDPREVMKELYEAAKHYIATVDSLKTKGPPVKLNKKDKKRAYEAVDRLVYATEDVKKL